MARFLILLFCLVNSALSSPYTVNVDRETGLKYFWYDAGNGKSVKAFLEGGPAPVPKATEDDVHFFLFTKSNPTTGQELKPGCDSCLDGSNFNPSAPVKFVCHGFMSSYESDVNVLMRNAYFRLNSDTNVIVVNWEKLAAAPWYDAAAANTKPVGQYIATLIDYLVSRGKTSYGSVHFNGHSLGSHVGGFAGSNSGGQIGRITALDPALPLFGNQADSERIDASDAAFVDVIHTAGGGLAFDTSRGHVDFYPNEGIPDQPGCGIDVIDTCSHGRAYEFMAETIWHSNGFPAYKCNSWADFNSGSCSMTDRVFMGENVAQSARGNYYLRTNANSPFGQE